MNNRATTKVVIAGLGGYVPGQPVLNADLAASQKEPLSEAFIKKRIGIQQRYFAADNQACSDLALKAAEQAIQNAGIDKHTLSRIVVSTSTPDYLSPSTACVLQHKLGLRGCPAFDISAACSGFVYGLDIAKRFVETGDDHVLLVSVDLRSRTLDINDRRTAYLYGDGAGAVIVSKGDTPYQGLVASKLFADGEGHDAVYVPSVGSASDTPNDVLQMPNGKRVADNALLGLEQLVKGVLDENDFAFNDVDFFVFHQPNATLLRQGIERLGIEEAKTIVTFPQFGNTVSSSIPLALNEAVVTERVKPGDWLIFCAIGAGYTGGAHLLQWGA